MARPERPAAGARGLRRHPRRRRRGGGGAALPVARSPRSPLRAVVWDYDGTLVDTRRTDELAVAALVAEDPGAAAGVPTFWALEGRPLLERLAAAWPGRVDQVLPRFDQETVPRVFGGIRPALRRLAEAGVGMAVVSSRRLEPLERGLRACSLRPAFAIVVGLESVAAPKPDPAGLLITLEHLGVEPGQAVFVGDRDVDAQTGRNAGTESWTALWAGRREGDEVPAAGDTVRRPLDVVRRVLGTTGGPTPSGKR